MINLLRTNNSTLTPTDSLIIVKPVIFNGDLYLSNSTSITFNSNSGQSGSISVSGTLGIDSTTQINVIATTKPENGGSVSVTLFNYGSISFQNGTNIFYRC